MTRRALVLVALALVPTLLRADAPAASPSPAAPRIVVEPASFDFGTIKPGGVVQREFVLRNIGRADLVIEEIVSSCNCTAILEETPQTLKPGARTPMRVRLTAPAEAGKLQKSVLIKSNDPAQRTFEVKVEALVASPREGKH
jgi:uncharacterized protein DUF1573